MDLKKLKQKLAPYGVTTGILEGGLFKKLSSLIQDDEDILYSCKGQDLDGTHIITVTNKNIYVCGHHGGFFILSILAVDTITIPISEIKSIYIESAPLLGAMKILYILEGTIPHKIKYISQEYANNIIKIVNNIKHLDDKQNISSISQADELIKFKKLLDEGVISVEEFNRKKEKIINS